VHFQFLRCASHNEQKLQEHCILFIFGEIQHIFQAVSQFDKKSEKISVLPYHFSPFPALSIKALPSKKKKQTGLLKDSCCQYNIMK
jgi:hypothetical protein